MSRKLFASLVSQSENLGDLVIRRNALQLAASGRPVVALGSGMPAEFINAFQLPPGSRCVQSPVYFQFLLFFAIFRREANLLLAPGPVVLSGSMRQLLKAAILVANSMLVRSSGGEVWSVGRSYRGASRLARKVELVQRRACSKYYVRDYESSCILDSHVVVKPDMAFADSHLEGSTDRKYIAVSLRSFGEDSFTDLQNLKAVAQQRSLEVILVSQVKFDERVHEMLAERLGVAHVAWGGLPHAEQLERVSDVYSQSALVVSNRLHSLIFGLRCGAVAVAFEPTKNPKLVSTLGDRVPLWELGESLKCAQSFFDAIPQLRRDSLSAWRLARRELLEFIYT